MYNLFHKNFSTLIKAIMAFMIISGFLTGAQNLNAQYSISGMAWHDLNGNGAKDGEPGMPNVEVTLYDLTNTVVAGPVTTDGTGQYSFTGLAAGDYYVEFSPSADYILSPGLDNDVTDFHGPGTTNTIIIVASNIINIDAGYFIYSEINGQTWHDINGNGFKAGEPGLDGIAVTLTGTDGAGAAVNIVEVTAGGGFYVFDEVPPGTGYSINFEIPVPYVLTEQGGDSYPDPVTGDYALGDIVSDEIFANIDAGYFIYSEINGQTWEDVNGDGLKGGEPGLDGITVTLTGTDGAGAAVSMTEVTAGGGFYVFDEVPPGTGYSINFEIPVPYVLTEQGGDSYPDPVTGDYALGDIVSDEIIPDIDAGYFIYGEINGQTWHDIDGNGFKDDGEFIDGVSVTLTGTAGTGAAVNMTEVTAGGGLYVFEDVPPGTGYVINFDPTPLTFNSLTEPGNDSYPDPATGDTNPFDVESNNLFADIDAGYWRYVTIGDWVWEDMNGNGVQDDGATGVENIRVQLGDQDGFLVEEVFTDAAGNYVFDEVGPGEYFIAFLPDPPYILTDQNLGGPNDDSDPDPNTGWTVNFTIESGGTDLSWDAGVWRSVQIGDYCWRDQNQNGIQDAGEFAMSDIEVMLFRASDGVNLATVVTDAAGLYQFGPNPPIKPGEYYLRFGIPATFNLTIQNAGGNPAIDSDPDPATGETAVVLFESGETDNTIDAGYYVVPPTDCDAPAADDCADAEVLCSLEDLNEFCASMVEQFTSIPIPGCGPGYAWHNPSWYAFVAGAEDVVLIIHTSNCVAGPGGGNIGIQYGFYSDCTYSTPILLQCPCTPPNGDFEIELNNLTVGNTYYFFIDGCSGTQCTYWIEIIEGGGVPEVFGPNGILCDADFPDCEDICVGANVTFTLEDVINAVDFEWTINGGAMIETSDPELIYQFTSPGTYTICGRGVNDCDEGEWFCFDVVVTQIPPEDLGTWDVCENELPDGFYPDGWEGPAITTPGNHTYITQNDVGCTFDQQVVVNAIPLEEIVVDTIGCENEEMWIGGEQFASNVTDYVFLVDDAGSNGCDLRYKVTVSFLFIDGYIEADCSGIPDRPVKITFTPNSYTGSDQISYQWYWNGIEIADDDPSTPNVINIDQSGNYSVVITLTTDGVSCVYYHVPEITVDLELFKPDTPVAFEWETTICNNLDQNYDYAIENTNPAYQYFWSYPADVNSAEVSANGQLLTVNWLNTSAGIKEICVYGLDPECGYTDTICEQITVLAAPTSEFTMLDTICLTSENIITYTGTGTPAGQYTWTFDGGTETSGTNGDGQGPHNVIWDNIGTKTVSLEVLENACLSPILEKPVEVVAPPELPEVECLSSTTSLTFSWQVPVVGSTGEVVELLEGQAGNQVGNTYVVTGLNPEDSVTIRLLVQTDGYCPPIWTDSITCKALACPPIDVTSFPADTAICLDGSNMEFLLEYEISPLDTGIISWSGPGIIDTETGLFHPDTAGVGSHAIVMRYSYVGCTYTDTTQVAIFAQPVPDFSVIDTMCMTATNLITYTGTGTPAGNYSWDFSGGTETSGTNGQGQGPHTISWGTPGEKTVSVSVIENGCPSDTIQKDVFVVLPPAEPVVNCDSTATSLTFSWDPVAGSTGVVAVLLEGQEGTQDGNSYRITGMNPNDTVTIELWVQTDGFCEELRDTITCFSKNCPVVTVDVFPSDTLICYDGTNPAFFLDYSIDPPGTGIVNWSGPGIVDENTGLFDPQVAGVGIHTISMTYDFQECVYPHSTQIYMYEQPTHDFTIDNSEICIKDAVNIVYNGNAADGNPTWDFDGGIVVDGSGLEDHIIRWNTSGTKNVQLSVERNTCISDPLSIPVIVHDTLLDLVFDCDPEVDNVTFSWGYNNFPWGTLDPQAESYRVLINGTEVSNSLITSWNVDGLEPGDMVDISIEIIDKGICGNKIFDYNCEAIQCPDYTINISPGIDEVCLDPNTPTIQFVADVTSTDGSTAGTRTWFGQGINSETGVFDPKIAGPGIHTLRLNYRDVCTANQEFTIHVIQRPVAEFSVSETPICVTDNTTITFNDMNPGTSVYTWDYSGGERTDLTASSFTMSWDNPGTYDISLSIDNMGCESGMITEAVIVEPELIPPVVECVNITTYSVGISWNDIDCASNYRVLVNGSQVAQGPSLTYNVANLDPEVLVEFTVEALSDCACGNVVSATTCRTEPCPVVSLNILGLPEHQCASEAGSVTLNPEITGPAGGTVEWIGPGISSNGNIGLQSLGTGDFTYGMKYTLANCEYETEASIQITPNPVFALTKTDPLCHNDVNGTISVTQPAGMDFFIGTQSSDNGTFEGLPSGNYTILARDSYACESTESITLNNPALMQPEIAGNVVINENQRNEFQLINISGFQLSDIIWSLENEGIVCQGIECISVDVGINDDDRLCVEVYDINGCYAITCRDVTFYESVNIDIPNVFSPDGDGINDIFYVRSSRIVEGIKEMRIFDRWGELVFLQENVPVNDPAYGWNGDHRGKKVNPGVYVYYMVFRVRDREDIKLVGDVTIIR